MFKLVVIGWLICGILAYGFTFGEFQTSFPSLAYKHRYWDRFLATFFGLTGPIGLTTALLLSYLERANSVWPPPLMFKGLTREQSVEAHRKLYPSIPVDF